MTIGCATNYNLLRLLLRVVVEAAKIVRVRDAYNMSG
jgi:hypothetical protein